MSRQPLLICCAFLIFGILVREYVPISKTIAPFAPAATFICAVVIGIRALWASRLKPLALWALYLFCGLFIHNVNLTAPNLPKLEKQETIVFKARKKLNSNSRNRRYEIKILQRAESQPDFPQANAVLSVPKDLGELDFLHYYRAKVLINQLQAKKQNFGFDYAKYLARQNIYFQCYLPESLEAARKGTIGFSETVRQQRLNLLHRIDSAGLSPKTREFTKGIILADRTEMDRGVVQDFSRSGLVHILAISGSHMAIIFWLVLFILKPIFPPQYRQIPVALSLVLIWTFAVFIDYGSSVVRSCIMISVYYLYIILQRKPDLLHAMGLSAMLILVCDSNQLFDLGFQLSYIAVFGIFWLNKPILKYLPKPKGGLQNFLVNVASVSIAAQAATLPAVLYHFHQYSWISIPANLIIIPISEVVIIFSLLMTVLLAFSVQISWLDNIYDFVVTGLLKAIHLFAEQDYAFYRNIPMSELEAIFLFGTIYFLRMALLRFNHKNSLRLGICMVLFLMAKTTYDLQALYRREVFVHDYFKHRIISIKAKDSVAFYKSRELKREKVEDFIINPYLTSRRTTKFVLKNLPDSTKTATVLGKRYNLK